MPPRTSTPYKSKQSLKDKTLAGIGDLINLLPSGTVFLYQFLSPLLYNNGHCETNPLYNYLTIALIAACGISCLVSPFTDSYVDANGDPHYGIATAKGLYPSLPPGVDGSEYKICIGDFVHGFWSLVVFGVVALLDAHTMECLYPMFEASQEVLIMVLPPIVGAVSGVVFLIFPSRRHGIGYSGISTY